MNDSKSLVTHYSFADNYPLGLMGDNLIWLYVFALTVDETQVQKVDIHPFITKPIEVTIPPMKFFCWLQLCIAKHELVVDHCQCLFPQMNCFKSSVQHDNKYIGLPYS
jgi:hypothetical protein